MSYSNTTSYQRDVEQSNFQNLTSWLTDHQGATLRELEVGPLRIGSTRNGRLAAAALKVLKSYRESLRRLGNENTRLRDENFRMRELHVMDGDEWMTEAGL